MKLLITGAGFQGGYSLVKELKRYFKEIEIIGIDIEPNSAAQIYCDKFYLQKDFEFIIALEKPDLILPATSYFIPLGVERGILLSSGRTETNICLSKVKIYETLKGIIPLPKYINSLLGYVSKLDKGKGGKGIEWLEGEERFIMERLSGEEIDVDVLSWKGELLVAVCKTRERAYGGTLIQGEIVKRPEIIKQIEKILKVIPLSYLSVFQFIGGKLLEINPRIAGTMIYTESFNLAALAIKMAMGELKLKQIKQYQNEVPYGKRIYKTMINL